MIFPGHVAASWLCHRQLKLDLRLTLLAGLLPDAVDKVCYHLLHLVPSSRLPMHTLWGWIATTLLVAWVGYALHRDARWGLAWGVGFAAHLLCDSPLVGDDLPFLYPLLSYRLPPGSFVLLWSLDLAHWPWPKLIAEALLVALTLITNRHRLSSKWRSKVGGQRAGIRSASGPELRGTSEPENEFPGLGSGSPTG